MAASSQPEQLSQLRLHAEYSMRMLEHAPKGTMNIANTLPSIANPRWDGARILFQIEIAGQVIACDISRSALQELGNSEPVSSGDLLRRFVATRDRIAAIATNMFIGGLGSGWRTLHIHAGDIYDPPSSPAVALQATRRVPELQTHHSAGRLSVAA